MTIETWIDEVCPSSPTPDMAPMEAVDHSLKRWEGLRPEMLEKHGLVKIPKTIFLYEEGGREYDIDSTGCALCKVFFNLDDEDNFSCGDCPLAQVRGFACDETRPDEYLSPYAAFKYYNDPEPMIMWLKKAKELVTRDNQQGHQE